MEYSQRILELMSIKGVTAYKVSKGTGLSESTFNYWKNKPTSRIPAENIQKIADFLGVAITEIVGEDSDKKISPLSLEEAEEAYVRALEQQGYIQKGKKLTKKEKERLRRAARIALED